VDLNTLCRSYTNLFDQAETSQLANTRIGYLGAVQKFAEAAAVADLMGGADGAGMRSDAYYARSSCFAHLGNHSASAHAAASMLRAARESGSRTALVGALARPLRQSG